MLSVYTRYGTTLSVAYRNGSYTVYREHAEVFEIDEFTTDDIIEVIDYIVGEIEMDLIYYEPEDTDIVGVVATVVGNSQYYPLRYTDKLALEIGLVRAFNAIEIARPSLFE